MINEVINKLFFKTKEVEFEKRLEELKTYATIPFILSFCCLDVIFIFILDKKNEYSGAAYLFMFLGAVAGVLIGWFVLRYRGKLRKEWEQRQFEEQFDKIFWLLLKKNNGIITVGQLIQESHSERSVIEDYLIEKSRKYLASSNLQIDNNGNVVYDFSSLFQHSDAVDDLSKTIDEAVKRKKRK
ncbi:MAG: hypothetical protein LBO69_01450 [Ignavibacteria bacterium]|jgi:nitrogen regulatory protein PII-like uncharacterized protein|nr:hypothetical protein [Ignavibacteria bacterium]